MIPKKPVFMIPEEAFNIILAGKGDAFGAFRAAIDEVSDLDEVVFGGGCKVIEQLLELKEAAVNVPDGNHSTHAQSILSLQLEGRGP
jgi:hypothetical protein